MASERIAEGRKVLVVEDEMAIVLVIEDTLLELGVEVIGPTAHLNVAVQLAREAPIDAAVLDINIRGGNSYPVADILAERGIPFILCSGTYERLAKATGCSVRSESTARDRAIIIAKDHCSFRSAECDRLGWLLQAGKP